MKTSDKESMLEYCLSFETDPELVNSEISYLYNAIDEFLSEPNNMEMETSECNCFEIQPQTDLSVSTIESGHSADSTNSSLCADNNLTNESPLSVKEAILSYALKKERSTFDCSVTSKYCFHSFVKTRLKYIFVF